LRYCKANSFCLRMNALMSFWNIIWNKMSHFGSLNKVTSLSLILKAFLHLCLWATLPSSCCCHKCPQTRFVWTMTLTVAPSPWFVSWLQLSMQGGLSLRQAI
jgi:hypothetical protein